MTKHAAIYIRVATRDTWDKQLDPLQAQTMLCQQYCNAQGHLVDSEHIYQEVASGADCRNRPQLKALLIAASNHAFDLVVIVAYDRLARNPLHVAALLETFDGLGMPIELTYEHHFAQPSFPHMLHAFQVEQQRERFHAAKGDSNPHTHQQLIVNSEAAQLVQQLFEGTASGVDLPTLATLCNTNARLSVSGTRPENTRSLGSVWEQQATHSHAIEG